MLVVGVVGEQGSDAWGKLAWPGGWLVKRVAGVRG